MLPVSNMSYETDKMEDDIQISDLPIFTRAAGIHAVSTCFLLQISILKMANGTLLDRLVWQFHHLWRECNNARLSIKTDHNGNAYALPSWSVSIESLALLIDSRHKWRNCQTRRSSKVPLAILRIEIWSKNTCSLHGYLQTTLWLVWLYGIQW